MIKIKDFDILRLGRCSTARQPCGGLAQSLPSAPVVVILLSDARRSWWCAGGEKERQFSAWWSHQRGHQHFALHQRACPSPARCRLEWPDRWRAATLNVGLGPKWLQLLHQSLPAAIAVEELKDQSRVL